MKKLLSILLLFIALSCIGQDIKPTDAGFKLIPSASFSYWTNDSSVWIYKGSAYGWTKLVSKQMLSHSIDSLKTAGYTKAEINTLLTGKAPESGSTKYIQNNVSGTQSPGRIDIDGNINTNYGISIGGYVFANNKNTGGTVAIGSHSLEQLEEPETSSNIGIGSYTLYSTTTGTNNIAIGVSAGQNNVTGYSNVFLGTLSGRSTTGARNVGIGPSSLQNNTTGMNNMAIGAQALVTVNGNGNIAIGSEAGRYFTEWFSPLTLANNSIFIGNGARASTNDNTNEIVLGNGAIGRGSNTATWGTNAITDHFFYGTINTSALKLTTGASAGYYLKSDALGNGSWSPVSASQVYKGTWNASLGVAPVGTIAGWYYRVTTAGTWNSITFAVGDDINYNGTAWERIPSQGYTLQTASSSVLGGVKIGSGVSIDGTGNIYVSTNYENPLGNPSTNGYVLSSSVSGVRSWVTPQSGPQGIQGIQGIQGMVGATGNTGPPGIQGLTGLTGSTGVAGTNGTNGAQGIQGVKGDKGDTGLAGTNGAQGIQGVKGDTGWTGSTGATGSQGLQGIQGPAGATGPAGYTPVKNVDYFDGATGSQGIQGVAGSDAPTGTYVPYTGATQNVNLGTYTITGGNFQLSDRKLKRNIRSITNLSDFSRVNFVQYSMKTDTNRLKHFGVIAQDLEKIAPELVNTDKYGTKSVNYIELFVAKIAELENRIKAIEHEK